MGPLAAGFMQSLFEAEAEEIVLDSPVIVYIVNNAAHRLIINGIEFADYGEVTDSNDMTMQERLDYLNGNSTLREEAPRAFR